MATNLILTKRGNALIADDSLSIEHIAKIKEGQRVRCVVTVPRNIGHHRLLFAMLNLVMSNQPEPKLFPTTDGLLDALKMATGHVREVRDLKGNTHFVPKSIDFATLDDIQFREWFDQAVTVILERILPHMPRGTLEQELYTMMGQGGPAQLER